MLTYTHIDRHKHKFIHDNTHLYNAHRCSGQSGVAPWHWSIVSDSLLPLMSEVRWLLSEQLPTTPLQCCGKLHPVQLSTTHWHTHWAINNQKCLLLLSSSTYYVHFISNICLFCLPTDIHERSVYQTMRGGAALTLDQYWECSYRAVKPAIVFREGAWWSTSSSSACNHSLGKSTDEDTVKERKKHLFIY